MNNQRLHSHLCLVSAQAVPNLTPLLDPDFQPEAVVLLISPDMRQRADWLTEVLKPRGIQVAQRLINDPWDIVHLTDCVWKLLDEYPHEIALNATGGTKPMSIAAYEAFRDWQKPIFYVHPEQDRVIWMHPREWQDFDLADRIRLEAFLQAHGARIESVVDRAPIPRHLRQLSETLIADLNRFSQPLRVLNWLASQAESNLHSPSLSQYQQTDPNLIELINRFANAGLLRFASDHLVFPDEAARFFANGGWLEDYVFSVLQGLRAELPQLQDLGRSIQVFRQIRGQEVHNELDVAFLADNRFYLIECKTRYWQQPNEDGPGAEAIYKLDTLQELLGGLQARSMLVSYQDLPAHDRRRASDLRIAVCAGTETHRLRERLKQWISG